MEQNLGKGLSAKCVIIPGKLCNSDKPQDNYINKIVEMPLDDIHMKKILLNEILISKLIRKRTKEQKKSTEWLEEQFGIIEDVCPLKDFTESIIKKCDIDTKLKENYFIYVIKNAGCRPIKTGSKVKLVDGTSGTITKYRGNNIKVEKDGVEKSIKIEEIMSGCGDFTNKSVLDIISSKNIKFIKYMFLKLLNSIKFLHSINIVHCDIKHPNIIMDSDLNVRIVDFGSAINLLDFTQQEFKDFCANLPLIYSSKKVNFFIKEAFRDLSTTRKKLQVVENMQQTLTEKIGAMSMMYVPPEIVIANHLSSPKEHILEVVLDFCKLSSKHTKEIEELIKRKQEIINDLFCKKNPELFKYDVYSLGIFFGYLVISCKIKNKDLNDLIKKMMTINYKKRPSIDECINHKFFK